MISFLTCNAKAVLKLILEVSYQDKDRICTQTFEVATDKVYKITVADATAGLRTYNCRIVGYTMCSTDEVLEFVNPYTKPSVVDTLKIDYSENNLSKTTSINVCDIRYIEELSTSGFDEIVNPVIPTFK